MPLGLDTSRQAIDTTMEAQIVQQLTGQAQQTDFSSLYTLTNGTPICFDANGNIITSGTVLYKACFSNPTNTVLPGGATTARLSTLAIYVLSTRTPNGMVEQNPATNTYAKKYIVHVADNGR
jgi:uncharacterized protein (TIGR02598 family)